jgi:hypothetical protein
MSNCHAGNTAGAVWCNVEIRAIEIFAAAALEELAVLRAVTQSHCGRVQ